MGGRQKTTLFMAVGESGGPKEAEKSKGEGKRPASGEKEKKKK